MAPKDEKKTRKKDEPKVPEIDTSKTEPKKTDLKVLANAIEEAKQVKGQVKIFTSDDPGPVKITAEKYCSGTPLKMDQTAGFLAECRAKYETTALATVQEWADRHETFKKRPIK